MVLKEGKPEEVGMSTEGIKRAEEAAKRLVDNGNTPSIITLIARDNVIVSHKAFGTNGMEEGAQPLALDAIFPVCSVTKSITAVCIMMLVEQGLVGLNRPVADYVPEFDNEERKDIRVYHLLTHSSGINDEEEELRITNKPGEVMSYCSYGYGMLGEIIKNVTGIPFGEYAAEKVFKPLGMKDSFLEVPDSVKHRVVKRSAPAIFWEWLTSEHSLKSTSPGGGMYTTVMDLAIFCSMLQNGGIYNGVRLISPVSVKEMTRNHLPGVASAYRGEFFPEAYWGLGFGINGTKKDGGDLFSPEAYSHWGAAGVFFCVDPVYRTIQIFFTVEIDHHKPFLNIYADAFNNAALGAITEL